MIIWTFAICLGFAVYLAFLFVYLIFCIIRYFYYGLWKEDEYL